MSLPASKLFDLNALRVFLTLAQTGSMRKTAQQFGLSVSAVSQSISSLEKQVGVELFNPVLSKINFQTDKNRRQ